MMDKMMKIPRGRCIHPLHRACGMKDPLDCKVHATQARAAERERLAAQWDRSRLTDA